MKLNYRDRIVLTIVIVIVVWALGIMFFIKPAVEGVQDSQAALDDAKAKRATLQARVDEDADLPQRIEQAYKEVTKMTESFYDIQETQIATQKVDDLLLGDELKNLDMQISDYSIMTLKPYEYISKRPETDIDKTVVNYKNNEAMDVSDGKKVVTPTNGESNVDAKGEVHAAAAMIGYYGIKFEFKGKLDDFESFCEKMKTQNEEKTMFISAMEFKFDEEEDSANNDGDKKEKKLSETDISGEMTLQMMVVEKLPDPNTLAQTTPESAKTDADADADAAAEPADTSEK